MIPRSNSLVVDPILKCGNLAGVNNSNFPPHPASRPSCRPSAPSGLRQAAGVGLPPPPPEPSPSSTSSYPVRLPLCLGATALEGVGQQGSPRRTTAVLPTTKLLLIQVQQLLLGTKAIATAADRINLPKVGSIQ